MADYSIIFILTFNAEKEMLTIAKGNTETALSRAI